MISMPRLLGSHDATAGSSETRSSAVTTSTSTRNDKQVERQAPVDRIGPAPRQPRSVWVWLATAAWIAGCLVLIASLCRPLLLPFARRGSLNLAGTAAEDRGARLVQSGRPAGNDGTR